eukprot:Blabericola_migrator_1__6111@NODE_3086_length_2050_cov_15_084216_g1932_i0_p1_GENE_NODE_3086_length_2050_cov_15_084216_g1932_i0NODE_3086_length_2050_cov_15_084216_g1932_i0_p1_ORF_typecomplete_len217_score17_73zfRING_5/PF14634_6/3_7e02zfRING_5/PF14634_6/0_65ProkRING_4/PF14447_6/1_5e03ProkRING_4/PF14447_6/0_55zfC3HC4_5/PF17121_5/2_7e03zfC3HC4_5/PF17121_5/9e03zfC3HC4_5/PF17121_5/0_11zfC3HC4_5/PF17121_5/4_4e02zfC3HC4/PF00097_25/0_33zfRING_UBOX/PF13445_6/0_4ProkRING_2/PF14445_6/8_4e02ProkRING_2/PF1444
MPVRWADDSFEDADSAKQITTPTHSPASCPEVIEISDPGSQGETLLASRTPPTAPNLPSSPPSKKTRLSAHSSGEGYPVPYYATVWDMKVCDQEGGDEILGPRPITLGTAFALGDGEKRREWMTRSLAIANADYTARSMVDQLAERVTCRVCEAPCSEALVAKEEEGASTPLGKNRFFIMPCGHPVCRGCVQLPRVHCKRCKTYNPSSRCVRLYFT